MIDNTFSKGHLIFFFKYLSRRGRTCHDSQTRNHASPPLCLLLLTNIWQEKVTYCFPENLKLIVSDYYFSIFQKEHVALPPKNSVLVTFFFK